jgi:phosphate starvation-inducible membrane PsiE
MRFCVYLGITTLINLVYRNRGHAEVVATNLKQRMYNLTMSCGRVLLDKVRHFF